MKKKMKLIKQIMIVKCILLKTKQKKNYKNYGFILMSAISK